MHEWGRYLRPPTPPLLPSFDKSPGDNTGPNFTMAFVPPVAWSSSLSPERPCGYEAHLL